MISTFTHTHTHTQTHTHTHTHTLTHSLTHTTLCSCTNGTEEEELNLEQLLYVGGINPLLSTTGESAQFGLTSDFIGAIRNIIIDQSQLNSKCPQKDENTFIGKRHDIETQNSL